MNLWTENRMLVAVFIFTSQDMSDKIAIYEMEYVYIIVNALC